MSSPATTAKAPFAIGVTRNEVAGSFRKPIKPCRRHDKTPEHPTVITVSIRREIDHRFGHRQLLTAETALRSRSIRRADSYRSGNIAIGFSCRDCMNLMIKRLRGIYKPSLRTYLEEKFGSSRF